MASEGMLSVVIPVYRSERYLERTVLDLVATLEKVTPFEIVLVNDGSPDGVQAVIDEALLEGRADPVRRPGRNLGQHRATLLGFARTRGDAVVTVDDDGQNPPEAALAVARELRERDLDVAYGRFEVVEQSAFRRLASAANNWLSARTIQNSLGDHAHQRPRDPGRPGARPGPGAGSVPLHRRDDLPDGLAVRERLRSPSAEDGRWLELLPGKAPVALDLAPHQPLDHSAQGRDDRLLRGLGPRLRWWGACNSCGHSWTGRRRPAGSPSSAQ